MMSSSFGYEGNDEEVGGVGARAGEGLMTRLPVEATDTLVMDAVFLVVSCMVTGETEWFFRHCVPEGEMIEFLEEGESIEISLLFIYDGVGSSDVFEVAVCLVSTVQGEEGAAGLAVSEDGDF